MQPFTYTQQYQKMAQHFATISQPSITLNNHQQNLLQTIANH